MASVLPMTNPDHGSHQPANSQPLQTGMKNSHDHYRFPPTRRDLHTSTRPFPDMERDISPQSPTGSPCQHEYTRSSSSSSDESPDIERFKPGLARINESEENMHDFHRPAYIRRKARSEHPKNSSSRDARKKSRRHSVDGSRDLSPSGMSVVSSYSVRSNTSNASTRTMTRRLKHSQQSIADLTPRQRDIPIETYIVEPQSTIKPIDQESVDVFSYLAEDEGDGILDREADTAASQSPERTELKAENERSPSPPSLPDNFWLDGIPNPSQCKRSSLHSDSGISLCESSQISTSDSGRSLPDHDLMVDGSRDEDGEVAEASPEVVADDLENDDTAAEEVDDQELNLIEVAALKLDCSGQDRGNLDTRNGQSNPVSPQTPRNPARNLLVKGYSQLASVLKVDRRSMNRGSTRLIPLYRRFEDLQHRTLLHMQDEISELEEELQSVDRAIAGRWETSTGTQPPASRRGDLRTGYSLQFRRVELLGQIRVKLDAYYKALASFKDAMQSTEGAPATAIRPYKSWLQENHAIVNEETSFLDHESDLMQLQNQPISTGSNAEFGTGGKMNYLPLMFLAIVFAVQSIPSLMGRLFFVVLIFGSSAVLRKRWEALLRILPQRDMTTCILLYVAIIFAIAGSIG